MELTHCTKMGAEKTQIPPKFICPICLPSTKVLDFNEKGLHWASVVREMYHVCCSAQTAYKLVKTSYAKQTTGAKDLTFPNIYTVVGTSCKRRREKKKKCFALHWWWPLICSNSHIEWHELRSGDRLLDNSDISPMKIKERKSLKKETWPIFIHELGFKFLFIFPKKIWKKRLIFS